MSDYKQFLSGKSQIDGDFGFEPTWMPAGVFDFQRQLIGWSCRKGRAAIFADCGMGKTLMQLAWSQNVVIKTNKPVLILTPLSVSGQTIREGEKFGIKVRRSRDGVVMPGDEILVTNYERLHHFNPADFAGTVCDESSILKNFDGVTRDAVIEFMRTQPYRLLCTATAAPNDYIEMGNSSEALGHLGYMDMLSKFFKNDQNSNHPNRLFAGGQWRFRGHAEEDFWRWVCSWARAIRKPSDLGFPDGAFILPPLQTVEHVVKASTTAPDMLFDLPAVGLAEQRDERRRSVPDRCAMAAGIANATPAPVVCWCHLNDEGDLLTKLIPGAIQVRGGDDDDEKEEAFAAFQSGHVRVMVTKPSIAGFGLNWQHCAHQTFFPSHSFEAWYQCVRRSWRFGQANPVKVDIITSAGESGVLKNLQRKAENAEVMFERLVLLMNRELHLETKNEFTAKQEIPSWL